MDLWRSSMDRYLEDYQLTQQNDKILVGSILAQQLLLFRSQQRVAGMVPEFKDGVPTGRYVHEEIKAAEIKALQEAITKTTAEIRETEKALGIDKKTREAGGTHTVQNYILTLKRAAREYGLHISRRVLLYEEFAMDLRQRLRILENADDEDRAYMQVSEQSICDWARERLGEFEEIDKQYAREHGKLYAGKL